MTLTEVKQRVANIVDLENDYEAAAGTEHKLYMDVLQAIADGKCDDVRRCATIALKSKQIKFERVYA